MPIGIRERAGVAPWLRSRGRDEVGTLGHDTFYERVGVGFRRCADDEETFVVAGWRDLALADGPPEPSTGGEQHTPTWALQVSCPLPGRSARLAGVQGGR